MSCDSEVITLSKVDKLFKYQTFKFLFSLLHSFLLSFPMVSFNPSICVLIISKSHQYFPRRLESYDRNKNFLPPPVLLPEPLDVNWPSTGIQQLKPAHQGLLPVVTRDQTEAYFLHRLAGFINLNI